MIAFSDSDGNVTIVGQLDEWIRLFQRVDARKLDEAKIAESAHYMLEVAASCNKFRQRRATDIVQN